IPNERRNFWPKSWGLVFTTWSTPTTTAWRGTRHCRQFAVSRRSKGCFSEESNRVEELLLTPSLPHPAIGSLDIPRKQRRVHQGRLSHLRAQPRPQLGESRYVSGQIQCDPHVSIDIGRYQSQQFQVRQDAQPSATDRSLPGQRDDWHSHPECITRCCAASHRKRI